MSPPVQTLAIGAGMLTSLALHFFPMRGDHAAILYFIAPAGFCFAVQSIPSVDMGLSEAMILSFKFMLIYTASALLGTGIYRVSPFHPLAKYPGPWLWRLSSLRLAYISYLGKRHLILDDLHRKYGPFVRIGPDALSINSLSANRIYGAQLHMEKGDSYLTPGHPDAVALFFKQKTRGIHTDRKRIWSAAFTGAATSHFVPILEQRTWDLVKCIETRQVSSSSKTVELADCLCHWAYDLMGDMVFGGCNNLELMKHGDPENLIYGGKLATLVLDSIGQSPWLMDLIWHLPAGNSMVLLRERAAAMMRNRVRMDSATTTRDIASYLLEGVMQSGEKIPLTDLELEAVVAIQGGSDNTSTTMALAFYFILSAPREYAYYTRLQAELDAAFPDPLGPLSLESLSALPFLNAVLNEALRLGSPFYLPRVVPPGGAIIEGKHLPENVQVAIAAYSQQTSPENFWPEPLEFRPERWLPDGLGPGSRTEKTALFSFSLGPHMCIARAFAFQEMRHVVARLVLAYDMALPSDFNAKQYRDGILNMRTTILQHALPVNIQRRPTVNLNRVVG
ncbi:cytochrome P450 family protein [Pleurotus pulmonarius]